MISTAIQDQLVGDAREGVDRFSELDPVLRIGQRRVEGALGNADGAGRSLDSGTFEGGHKLLEALPLDPAKEACGRHLETVERERVFLHAAIAEHRNFTARETVYRERVVLGAAGLFSEQDR